MRGRVSLSYSLAPTTMTLRVGTSMSAWIFRVDVRSRGIGIFNSYFHWEMRPEDEMSISYWADAADR